MLTIVVVVIRYKISHGTEREMNSLGDKGYKIGGERSSDAPSVIHTQDHDLSHSMTHYLLTIHKLKEERGFARVTDISSCLGLTKGSVSTALHNLRKRKLVKDVEDCKFLELTDRGHREVHDILSSRTLLFYFFRDALLVSEESSRKDSCLMEHLMSAETREKLFYFLCKIEKKKKIDSGIPFSRYKNYDEFLEDQKGDTHLEE